MRITYKVYDNDIHDYVPPDDVYIRPDGKIMYRNGPDWLEYPDGAVFLSIRAVEVTE